ncbi:hypothetical protein AB1L07_02085 [Niallia alba]|uniref:hypothetical protein n=1 Tax=Niallia alba TaxID=2729105 RepID=UPI0039A17768
MRDFKNLNAFQEVQINHILDTNKERDNRLRSIRQYLEKSYIIEEITEMNDYQIAKIRRKSNSGINEWLYSMFFNYNPIHEMAMTFDQAVLICLSYKYNNRNTDAALYLERILNASFMPEGIE